MITRWGNMEKKHFAGCGFASSDGKSIYVGNLPGRKRVCVYTMNDGTINVLAYCTSRESATKLLNWLDRLYGG